MKRRLLFPWLACGILHGEVENRILPGFDAALGYVSYAGGLDAGNGDLEATTFALRSILTPEVPRFGDLIIVPFIDYKLTALDVDGAPAGFPTDDEDLHSLSLSAFFVHMREGSPWFSTVWTRAELASDFQHVDGDDFTFDVAAGVGYRFNERFTLAAGATVINLNGDAAIYPGVNFDWQITDRFSAGVYGPSAIIVYRPDDNWIFSLRGEPAGGVWNVTGNAGESHSIDWTAYQAGCFASRRIRGSLWVTAGGGAMFSGDLDRTTPAGRKLAGSDGGTGWFGLVGLRLMVW